MLSHSFKRHKSAKSIVREFLKAQLKTTVEKHVWIPSHPSDDDDSGFTYNEMLRAVRGQRHWAFVRISTNDKAVIHFYATKDTPTPTIARMLGHELGHISGEILDNEAKEEQRADLYADVAERVFEVISPGRRSR